MKALDRYLEERDAEDTLLELLADGILEANEDEPRPILRIVREGETMGDERVLGGPVVSRRDWLHGELKCAGCGLPLDRRRDLVEDLWWNGFPKPYGARVRHTRCGTEATLHFKDYHDLNPVIDGMR